MVIHDNNKTASGSSSSTSDSASAGSGSGPRSAGPCMAAGFSKASFVVSGGSDSDNVAIDDPDFWTKVTD